MISLQISVFLFVLFFLDFFEFIHLNSTGKHVNSITLNIRLDYLTEEALE